ncbi:MAG: hypothetical protein IJU76_13915 [Desulfovibrionaceae bacterium]|nr:hypothetical protein [Desulfovibrionaceae bacterium]
MQRFFFVGNRRFVLQALLEMHVPLAGIGVVSGSHLANDIDQGTLGPIEAPIFPVHSKADLLTILAQTPFEVLVSNGCPYILPIADLPKATYVNIHPSLLPDLRGYDPVIGAILFGKDAGATCHLMDEGIDTGAIIAQVKIPITDDLDVVTLYQLSFVAERQVFSAAYARNFTPSHPQIVTGKEQSYRRRAEDMQISFREPNDVILRKVKAFNNAKIGCTFTCQGESYRVFAARRMDNPFLRDLVLSFPEGHIALSIEGSIFFHKDGEVLRFSQIRAEHGKTLAPNDVLF